MSLTGANVQISLSQPTLFPAPVALQGFAADDVFDIDRIRSVEHLMGVDGVLSYGFVWVEIAQNIALQADSPSNNFFDVLWTQMVAAEDNFAINGTVLIPGIQTKLIMFNGALTGYKLPDVKKIIQPRRYELTWNKIIVAPTL